MSERTVTINGTAYDVHTGMPVTKTAQSKQPVAAEVPKAHPSTAIHQSMQKSQTLNRRVVNQKKSSSAKSLPSSGVIKSPAVTKFAPHPVASKPQKVMSDIGPATHPMIARAHQQTSTISPSHAKAAPKPSRIIKEEAIADALKKAPSHSANNKQVSSKKYSRILSIASAGLALLLLGGYFTYLNMPSLSVRVAAAQAGVNATYPEYHPDGYSLNGPVAYSDGEVSMKFAANTGPQNFTISQSKSSWDSTALLDNYVKQRSNGNEVANIIHGVTVYTYNDNAAWVNGGILYKITGNAPLSSDQILHIATSM